MIFETLNIVYIQHFSTLLCCLALLTNSSLQAQELDLTYLLSDSPTIDYDAPELKKILSSSDSNIVKYYSAFIEYDQSAKLSNDMVKAKQKLAEFNNNEAQQYSTFHYRFKEVSNVNPTHTQVMELFFSLLASPNLENESIP